MKHFAPVWYSLQCSEAINLRLRATVRVLDEIF
jgi:hypothetical protein